MRSARAAFCARCVSRALRFLRAAFSARCVQRALRSACAAFCARCVLHALRSARAAAFCARGVLHARRSARLARSLFCARCYTRSQRKVQNSNQTTTSSCLSQTGTCWWFDLTGTRKRVLELKGSGVQGVLLWMLLWMFLWICCMSSLP